MATAEVPHSDVVRQIPRGSAPGEIPPIIAGGVSYPDEIEDVAAPVPSLADLIASHSPAVAELTKAEGELKAARARLDEFAPPRPRATLYRFDDPHPGVEGVWISPDGRRFSSYNEADIEELREAAEPQAFASFGGGHMHWQPDPRQIARKVEILAAYDGWRAEISHVAQQVGWTLASSEHHRAQQKARFVEAAILDAPTHTIAEIAAKARWIEMQGKLTEWSFVVLWDVIGLNDPDYLCGGGSVAPQAETEAA